MPAKLKGKGKKKTYARKKGYKWKATIQRMPMVSQRQIVKMNYGDTITLTGGGLGQSATYQFRANSIQDPDFTGIGHQPLSHDQWAPFYNHYSVISSRIRADFLPGTSASVNGSFLGALRVNDTSTTTTLSSTQVLENRQIKSGLCIISGKPLRLYNTYNAYKQFGIKAELGNTLSAQFGSNPQEDCFFQVSVMPNDPSVNVSCTVIILIEYTVLLMEPRALTQS